MKILGQQQVHWIISAFYQKSEILRAEKKRENVAVMRIQLKQTTGSWI